MFFFFSDEISVHHVNVKELNDYRKYTSNNGTDKNLTSSEYINESITSIFEDIKNIPSSNDDDINTNVTLSKYLTSEADNVILRLGHPRKTAGKVNFKNSRSDSSKLLVIFLHELPFYCLRRWEW